MRNIFVILLVSAFGVSFGQNPFVSRSVSIPTVSIERVNHSCELSTGSFIFVGSQIVKDSTGFLFRTDNMGNITLKRYLFAKTDSADFVPVSCIYENDNKVVLIGQVAKNQDSLSGLWYAIIDSNLQISYLKVIPFSNRDTSLSTCALFVKMGDSYYGSIDYRSSFLPALRTRLVKMDQFGAIVRSRDLDSSFYAFRHEDFLGISPITKGEKNHVLNFIGSVDGYLTSVDTNFNIVDTVSINTKFETLYTRDTALKTVGLTCVEVGSTTMLVGSVAELRYASVPFRWGVAKFDTRTKTISRFGCFPEFKDPYNIGFQPSTLLNIASRGSSTYTLSFSTGTAYKNSIVVCSYDTNARPKWIRYLSDSIHNFLPTSLFLCRNGSLLVHAIVDSATSPFDRNGRSQDIYVVRLDSASGYPLSIRNISEQLRQSVNVYPNPATTELRFSSLPNNAAYVLVYNALGQLLLQHDLRKSGNRVLLDALPVGTFYYAITEGNEAILSKGSFQKM